MSDLHLEVGNQYRTFHIPVEAPFLILAGDIGRLQDYEGYLHFLATQCDSFDMVFLILGNHEFYGLSRTAGLSLAHKLERDERTHGRLNVLHRTKLHIGPSLCILGCTLQSHIRPENRIQVERRMKDFQRIQNWSVEQHNEEHERDVDWLRNEIDSIQTRPEGTDGPKTILVITHHAPIRKGSSHPMHEKNPWSDGFATDVIGLHNQTSRVDWWVYGHTHYTTQLRSQGVRLVSNQRGYVPDPGHMACVTNGSKGQGGLQRVGSRLRRKSHEFDAHRCIKIRV